MVLGTCAASAQTAANTDGTVRQRPANTDASKTGKSGTTGRTSQQTQVTPVAKPAPQPVATTPAPKPVVVVQPPRETWSRGAHPYARQHHGECQEKAFRLHRFERRAAEDGRISRSERAAIRDLQRDLDRTCGRFRWNR